MIQTYFILSRQIFESAIWRDDPDILKLFIYLIGKARFKNEPKEYPTFKVNRGELITSLKAISEDNEYYFHKGIKCWSRQKISRMLAILQEQKYIELIADTYGTHIRICNYETYQDPDRYKTDNHGTMMERSWNDDGINSNKDKKDKNGKKDREEYICAKFDQFWDLYDKKIDRVSAERKFKNLTDEEIEAILKYIPEYKKAEPNKKYRKNPVTFLNNRSWENEIIVPKSPNKKEANLKALAEAE